MLQADRSLIDRRPRDDATGEVMTLQGKLDRKGMGDRYQRAKYGFICSFTHFSRPSGLEESKLKRQKFDEKTQAKKKSIIEGSTILSSQTYAAGLRYRPKTRETQRVYELILSFITAQLGSQPQDVLCGAADEVLDILKDEKTKVLPPHTYSLFSLMGIPVCWYCQSCHVSNFVTSLKPAFSL